MTLALILGLGALIFHKEKLSSLPEILIWLQQNKPGDVIASTPSTTSRADIYDRNFRPLAATYETYALYARPLEMENPGAAAAQLERLLGLEQSKLLADLKSERGFVWIAKGIAKDLADTIKDYNIRGVYQVVESKRFYPNAEGGAHAVGFVENDQGLDGIEFQYNAILRGDEISDAELQEMHFRTTDGFGTGGTHLVLNIDLMLQTKLERFLEKRARITGAVSGAVMLMDANSGNVLAMASYPAFNPNRYWEYSSGALNNNIVSQPVYPGELALIFQQAAAINLKHETEDAASNTEALAPLLVIEPQVLKRRKLSVAPPVDIVDSEYLTHFTQLLGFYQKPLTDIPLKDETTSTASVALNDPEFHTSAMRLLTGFTALMKNSGIPAPRLLHKAYPKDSPYPVEPTLTGNDQTPLLHPSTSRELADFLARQWLKVRPAIHDPMFFEAHRYAMPHRVPDQTSAKNDPPSNSEPAPRITQTVMLGAIPGKDPKLTIVAFLTYPDGSDEAYPDVLESFGNKFSILSPDTDMIKKMLFVAKQSPPVPSPDFWTDCGTVIAENLSPLQPVHNNIMAAGADNRKFMPDVKGKSLRAGLQTLQHYNIDIRLVGSGMIVSQHPAAGTELKNGAECLLKMQQEI